MPAITSNISRLGNPVTKEKQPWTGGAMTPGKETAMLRKARQLDSDEARYKAAVDMARMKIEANGGQTNPFGNDLKKYTDEYYGRMGRGGRTAAEIRGDNPFTDAVDFANGMINGFNVGVGNAIDTTFDNTVGNLAGLVSPDLGKTVKNWATGEDLAVIPDIATDVALYASGVGIPLAVAKNAVQMSPYMSDFISGITTGKETVSQEEMDPWQIAANGLLGFGGTALSMVPAIGKAKNIATAIGKSGEELGAEAGLDAAKSSLRNSGFADDVSDDILKQLENLGSTAEFGEKKGLADVLKDLNPKSNRDPLARKYAEKIAASDSVSGNYERTLASRLASQGLGADDYEKAIAEFGENVNPRNFDAVRGGYRKSRDLIDAVADLDASYEDDLVKALHELGGAYQDASSKYAKWEDLPAFDRAMDVIGRDYEGFWKGIEDAPDIVRRNREMYKAGSNGEKIASKVNKEQEELAKKAAGLSGEELEEFTRGLKTPAERFREMALDEYAGSIGKTGDALSPEEVAKAAKEYGIKINPDGTWKVPVEELTLGDRRIAGREGRKAWDMLKKSAASKDSDFELPTGPIKRHGAKKEAKSMGRGLMEEALQNTKKVDARALRGGGPIARTRANVEDVLNNIMESANRGAPATAIRSDRTGLGELKRNAKKAVTNQGKAGEIAKTYGGRALDTISGFGSSAAGSVLGTMAEIGGSPVDAMAAMNDYYAGRENGTTFGAIAPLLITGSKGYSRKAIPSLSGVRGASIAPHNAIRGLGSARQMGNTMGEDVYDEQSFIDALSYILDTYEEEH